MELARIEDRPALAAAELLLRREAKEGILKYIEYMSDSGLPDFHHKPADHHLLIAELLDSMAHGERDRVAISLPPGSAKSFYSSILFPTFLLARNPHWKILCLSNAETLAEEFSGRRRQILLSPEWERLAETSLLPDARGLAKQLVKEGGGIYCAGAGSTITGFRADVVIGDDLIKGHEQAANLTQLDKLWNWYLTEARSRLKPDPEKLGDYTEGMELQLATRWAMLDPIGRVLRLTQKGDEDWTYLRIPMEADEEDDPVGRKIGERLWADYFTPRMVSDAKRNPLMWKTLYQQKPGASENEWVGPSHIHLIDPREAPRDLVYYIGVDIALSVAKGDFTVFAVVGVDVEKNFYLVDVYRKQADPDEAAQAFINLCLQYAPRECWIENDNASKMWFRLAAEKARTNKVKCPLRYSKMRNNDKEARASGLRSMFMQDRILICKEPWTANALLEIAEFPGGRNDDFIDAFGVVAKELHRIVAPKLAERERPLERIKGAFQMVDGQIMTRQKLGDMWGGKAKGRSRI